MPSPNQPKRSARQAFVVKVKSISAIPTLRSKRPWGQKKIPDLIFPTRGKRILMGKVYRSYWTGNRGRPIVDRSCLGASFFGIMRLVRWSIWNTNNRRIGGPPIVNVHSGRLGHRWGRSSLPGWAGGARAGYSAGAATSCDLAARTVLDKCRRKIQGALLTASVTTASKARKTPLVNTMFVGNVWEIRQGVSLSHWQIW